MNLRLLLNSVRQESALLNKMRATNDSRWPETRVLEFGGLVLRFTMALVAVLIPSVAASDPFRQFETGANPTIVRDLGSETDRGVSLHRVVFYSRTVQTSDGPVDSLIYAVIARPVGGGRHPGLLLLHGGGGHAQEDLAEYWAREGYVAVAADLPGIANPKLTPNSSGVWKAAEYGKHHFTASPDATGADIFDGVLAALQSLYLLRVQPDVDLNRIGVTGVSWGGYATIMVAGLAPSDVKAAFAIYGSGHYDLGSSFQADLAKLPATEASEWLAELDAKNYAPQIKADFVEAAATNDDFFWMPAVAATLDDIRSRKDLILSPNSNHWIDAPGGCERTKEGVPHNNGWMDMQVTYFAYKLKGEGEPFPVVEHVKASRVSEERQSVRFRSKGGVGELTASVYYSRPESMWKKRKWIEVKGMRLGRDFVADIPNDVSWFASITDSRPVTVTSPIYPSPATPMQP